ncbi:MAG TPA: DUF6677 family protein [Candidatus Eisenbacteria bacterium]|nr:DUF6677 family protein [Candidatus Eisenbacteria bacterium]
MDEQPQIPLQAESTAPSSEPGQSAPEHAVDEGMSRETRALLYGAAGWLLPGMGHVLQRMWGRAIVVFLAVGILACAGAAMKGNVFTRDGSDAFDTLGFAADLGTGGFYAVARTMEPDGSDVSHADGDYGTRLLATAGVLNLLAALHAYEAARGRKA